MKIKIEYYDINGEQNSIYSNIEDAKDVITVINTLAAAGNFIIKICEVR